MRQKEGKTTPGRIYSRELDTEGWDHSHQNLKRTKTHTMKKERGDSQSLEHRGKT